MKLSFRLSVLCAVLVLGGSFPLAAQTPAPAAPKAKAQGRTNSGTPFAGFGANSRAPIKVDANKLEVFDKENRAVYSGDVVVVQGQTTVRCVTMTVFYAQNRGSGSGPAAGGNPQNAIRKIDCQGPLSLLSGTQSATAKLMIYDAGAETVTLTGNVVIADCENVQRGERVVYDVKTGKATVDSGGKGRVQGIFTPGGDDSKKTGKGECPPRAGGDAAPKTR